jgi:ribosomal protein S18 acetylase RimI-like enzyme
VNAGLTPAAGWVVTDLRPDDRADWEQMYRAYCDFYEVGSAPAKLDTVWSWLHDPEHEVSGIVVRPDADGHPVGFAHYRPFARPLHGSVGCFLDDLFVQPASRGTGAVDSLLAELRAIAATRHWDVVRWITRESNGRARSTYDRLAQQTNLITYDMAPIRLTP